MKFLIEAISKFTTKKYNNKWSYDRQDEWYAYNSCSCMLSPFNIKPNFFVSGMPKLNIINKQININIVNYDYTMQCHATGENILLVDDKQYNLVRFHFHYPSEYAINGQKFVMELHFVYQDAEENLLVLGVMVDIGEKNAEIEKLWQQIPNVTGRTSSIYIDVNMEKMLPQSLSYYRFMGSLTSPPCTKNVNWVMLRNTIFISKEQLEFFANAYVSNSRELQSDNKRLVIAER